MIIIGMKIREKNIMKIIMMTIMINHNDSLACARNGRNTFLWKFGVDNKYEFQRKKGIMKIVMMMMR